MKSDIFSQYVDRIIHLFNISREELFSKSKRRDIVDARHLLYYLCYKRQMTLSYIQKFMRESGYPTQHSSVIHGINIVTSRVKDDGDYLQVVKDIDKAVFI